MPKIIGNTTAAPKVLTEAEVITLVTSSEEVKDLIKEHGDDQVQADWNQDNQEAPDYIHNKPEIPSIEGLATEAFVEEKIAEVDVSADVTYTNSDPLLQDMGGILANNHPEGFDKVPINDLITELLYPYTKPVLSSFALTPSVGVKKKGTQITVTSASVKVAKKSKAISAVDLYRESTLLKSISNPTVTSSGATITFSDLSDSIDGTADTTYYVKVSEQNGAANVVSISAKYTFVNPYYYGVIAKDAEITADLIMGLAEDVRVKGDHSRSYNTNSQKPVIAYPDSYGPLKSITDAALPYTWDRYDVTINGVDYYVYVGSASTLTNTYNFKY